MKTSGLRIATMIVCFAAGSLPALSAGCIAAPSGLVSWWPGDTNSNDIAGQNNPNLTVGISYVPGEVLNGFSIGTNGYVQVAPSPSLANQNFTWAAWVKPAGPGPTNDNTGSAIVIQDIDDYNLSVALYWRATPDYRFVFIFGNSSTDTFNSTDTFPPGSFYHVAATYDGTTFKMYVNGKLEGSKAETKQVPYSTNPWSIGSSGQIGISVGFPRTFNGVIDEMQAFNRALAQSELQGIYAAGSAGECKSSSGSGGGGGNSGTPPPVVPSFTISTIAGNGTVGFSGSGGPAVNAQLNNPRGIVTDPAGNVYFCDLLNNVVQKVDTNGILTTIVGTGVAGYNGDNIPGSQAELNEPWRVTIDPAGNLYIADYGNNRIRKLAPNGIITTVAGNGRPDYSGDGGPALNATLDGPEQAEIDAFGNMYIADSGNNVIRKVSPSGIISSVAGSGFDAGLVNSKCTGGGYSGDGGPATKAELDLPVSLAVDPSDNLWISDQCNNVIRYVDSATGNISTVAGIYNAYGYTGDGGPATKATFNGPAGIARDAAGNIYVTDYGNNVLRVLLTNGNIATVAGNGYQGYSGDGGPATLAEMDSLRQVAVGTFGDIYIADTYNNAIRKLTPAAVTLGETTNAFGNIPNVAANTWFIIKGENLAPAGDSRIWTNSDFVNNQLPTSLDGVSVTIGGQNAFVYYISPTQINVLAPPSLGPGIAQLQVNNKGALSDPASVVVQAISPTFFTFTGSSYVTAIHANGSLIGPATLYPGYSTPAQPGETILLYANGFGSTSASVVSGSETQSGTLPSTPAVNIGGIPASVQFAGLISPGLYQFNVVVPTSLPAGDAAVTATYNGVSTQPGVLLSIN